MFRHFDYFSAIWRILRLVDKLEFKLGKCYYDQVGDNVSCKTLMQDLRTEKMGGFRFGFGFGTQAPRRSTHAKRAGQWDNVQMLHAIYSIVLGGISRLISVYL